MFNQLQRVDKNDPRAISLCTNALSFGKVILYPTDTVYGLGVDATSAESVELIKKIKGRVQSKPFLVMLPDVASFETYAVVNDTAREIIKTYLPGPLSLVLQGKEGVLESVKSEDGSVGFRLPNDVFCRTLVESYGKPVVSTSANMSGQTQQKSIDAILTQLGKGVDDVSVVVSRREVESKTNPSTVIDVRGEKVVVLREGAFNVSLLSRFL